MIDGIVQASLVSTCSCGSDTFVLGCVLCGKETVDSDTQYCYTCKMTVDPVRICECGKVVDA